MGGGDRELEELLKLDLGKLGDLQGLADVPGPVRLGEAPAPPSSGAAPEDGGEIPFALPPALEAKLEGMPEECGPDGPAFASAITQSRISGRTPEYKQTSREAYLRAVAEAGKLFELIRTRDLGTSGPVRSLVRELADIFAKDRNILLNLTWLPSEEDDYLHSHAVNVALLSTAIAAAAGFSREQVEAIAQGALLMDAGMVFVPEAIRTKKGKLTSGELYEIHKHPILSAQAADGLLDLPPLALATIYQHHERPTGTGYPKRRSGRGVHAASRIVGIADTYAALVQARSYRPALAPYRAMENVLKQGAAGFLDRDYVRHFLRFLSVFPVGSLVKLSSGAVAKVVHANPDAFDRPVVAILAEADGAPVRFPRLVDLRAAAQVKVVEALDHTALTHDWMDGF